MSTYIRNFFDGYLTKMEKRVEDTRNAIAKGEMILEVYKYQAGRLAGLQEAIKLFEEMRTE